MGDMIIVIGLLMTVGVAAFSLVRHRYSANIIGWIIGMLLVWAILLVIFLPLTYLLGGQSHFQSFLLTSLCFTLSAAIVTPHWRKYLLALACTFALLVALPWYAYSVLDTNHYTSYQRTTQYLRSSLIYELVDIKKTDEWSYPAGWLADQPFAKKIDRKLLQGIRITPHPCWHTWLTGLSRQEVVAGEAWYPGGKIKDAYRHIEIRAR